MVLAAKNSPLVSGGSAGKPAPAAGPVRLLRAICIKGERIEVDTVLQLDRTLASELISACKAVRVAVAPAPVQTPVQDKEKKPGAPPAPSTKKDPHHVEQ